MSWVSSCRTRCGYPENAAAIKRAELRLPAMLKTVPYPAFDVSRNVPTVFAVLPAPDVNVTVISARFMAGHGQASAAGHSLFAATFRP
jgi:hypothetical protein